MTGPPSGAGRRATWVGSNVGSGATPVKDDEGTPGSPWIATGGCAFDRVWSAGGQEAGWQQRYTAWFEDGQPGPG